MFSVIVPPIQPDSRFWRLFQRNRQMPVAVEIRCDRMDSTYYLIELKKHHDPENLRSLAWFFRGGLIASPKLDLPAKLERYQIPLEPFCQRLAENTVRYLLYRSYPTPYLQQLGIIDQDAKCQDMVERFVRICPHIRVFTQQTDAYQPFLQKMMEEYGASVVLTQELSGLQPCNLIFCPRDFFWQKPVHLAAPVICAGNCQISGSTLVIHDLLPQLDESFLEQVPQGILPIQFAAAFHHALPQSFLDNCRAASGVCRQNRPKTEEISRYIQNLVAQSSAQKSPSRPFRNTLTLK